MSKLHAILDPFVLRRLKTDVVLELPEKHVYVLYAPLSPQQVHINKAIKDNKLSELFEGGGGRGEEGGGEGETWESTHSSKAVSLSNMMMQARKNCNHPFLFQVRVCVCVCVCVCMRFFECLCMSDGTCVCV